MGFSPAFEESWRPHNAGGRVGGAPYGLRSEVLRGTRTVSRAVELRVENPARTNGLVDDAGVPHGAQLSELRDTIPCDFLMFYYF